MTTESPTFNPVNLIGRTFLLKPQENGERHRARIIDAIHGFNDDLGRNPIRIKFKLSINGDQFKDLMAYNKIMQHIESETHPKHTGTFVELYPLKVHSNPEIRSTRAVSGMYLLNGKMGRPQQRPSMCSAPATLYCAPYMPKKTTSYI